MCDPMFPVEPVKRTTGGLGGAEDALVFALGMFDVYFRTRASISVTLTPEGACWCWPPEAGSASLCRKEARLRTVGCSKTRLGETC